MPSNAKAPPAPEVMTGVGAMTMGCALQSTTAPAYPQAEVAGKSCGVGGAPDVVVHG